MAPVYPASLRARGIEATVLFGAIVSKDGVPGSLKVLRHPGPEEFVAAAMEAVGQWRYRSKLLKGQPIEVLTTIPVEFRISAGQSGN